MSNFKVAAHTLGCKVNQCDTEAISRLLCDIGCSVVEFNCKADMYIINTCTVTHASDRKSRQMIRRAKKLNPSAKVAVCGCMAKSSPTAVQGLGVDFVFDARHPQEFIEYVRNMITLPLATQTAPPQQNRTRAFIKIQDGCDRMCAYCIIPYVRGVPKSRDMNEILTEVKNHVANGTQEVVITGIQVAAYGEDTKYTRLPMLMKELLNINGLSRLRLSSIEPNAVTAEFLEAAASSQVLCDHFHLSLQSGCDATLQRMNRRYTTGEYAEIAARLRDIWPNAAITTDVIVGFPGETDEEFCDTLDFVQRIKFADIHVFEYSKRGGTPAATFPGQVADIVKTERSKKVREIATGLRLDFFRQQVGKIMPVLFESDNKGHTTNYCPVEIETTQKNLQNRIVDVEICGIKNNTLICNHA